VISLKSKIENMGYNADLISASVTESFRTAVAGLANAAHAEWIRLAQERLRTSADIYINGLQQSDSFTTRYERTEPYYDITLVGRMANNIEYGMDPFDMKAIRPGWLGGSKARVNKKGQSYVVIPFRHSTGPSRRFAYSGRAAAMGLQNKLKRTVREYGLNKMIRGARGNVIPGPVKRVPKRAPIHEYLRGITRVQQVARGTTSRGLQRGSSQLITWRVMSEASSPESWQHPGIEAKNLLEEVKQWVDREMERVVDTVMAGVTV